MAKSCTQFVMLFPFIRSPIESSSLGPCSLSHLQQHLRFEIFLFTLNNTRLWDLPSVSGQEFPLSASSSPEGVLSVPK